MKEKTKNYDIKKRKFKKKKNNKIRNLKIYY